MKKEIRIFWNDNPDCIKEHYFVNEDGKKDGPYKLHHPNGQEAIVCIFRDGKIHGIHNTYNANGELTSRSTYKNGKENGLYTSFYPKDTYSRLHHPNGSIEIQCHLKDGKLDGLYKEYWDNGQLRVKRTYRNNKIVNGICIKYSYFGLISDKGAYVNGRFVRGKEAYQKALAKRKERKKLQQAVLAEQKQQTR